jgi:aspartate kinase
VGRSYASSTPVEIEVLREIYERISSKYLDSHRRHEFLDTLDNFYRQVIISLKQAAENRRFVDVIRSRTLAYSGEVTMSYLMDYVMQSIGLKSSHVLIEKWPIITDDNFEAANFMVQESKHYADHLIDLWMDSKRHMSVEAQTGLLLILQFYSMIIMMSRSTLKRIAQS